MGLVTSRHPAALSVILLPHRHPAAPTVILPERSGTQDLALARPIRKLTSRFGQV